MFHGSKIKKVLYCTLCGKNDQRNICTKMYYNVLHTVTIVLDSENITSEKKKIRKLL